MNEMCLVTIHPGTTVDFMQRLGKILRKDLLLIDLDQMFCRIWSVDKQQSSYSCYNNCSLFAISSSKKFPNSDPMKLLKIIVLAINSDSESGATITLYWVWILIHRFN